MSLSVEVWHIFRGGGIVVLLAAAVASAGLILLLRPLLQRYALARPNARSSHRTPTPQGGGMAVVAATIGSVLAIMGTVGALNPDVLASLTPLFVATICIAIVGGIDDIHNIAVAPRLMLQALIVGLMIAFLPADLRLIEALPWWMERTLMLFACLWFVNLSNFMDGIDWMTVAEVIPITGGLVLIGLLGALPTHAVVVALALCGAMIGFAPFNRPVARLFLGDVGSLPIGLLLCWLLLLLAGSGHLAATVLLPLFYVADATITLLRRMTNRERFWEAHRSHFYQRAIDNGFSAMEVVARVLMVNLGLIALSVAVVLWPGSTTELAAIACGATMVGALLFVFARGKRR